MRIHFQRLFLALSIGAMGAICIAPSVPRAQSAQKPAKKGKAPAKKAAPATAPAPAPLPDPPLPVQQAQKLGLTQCLGMVDQISRGTLNSQYDVQSGWNGQAPAQHVFQSVAVVERPEVMPANGLAAIIATPTPGGTCDGVAVQVFPLASDCGTAQKYMQSAGSTPTPILNTQIMIDRDGKRVFLLPGVNKTCIAVSVDSSFGTAATPAAPAPVPMPQSTPQAAIPLPTPAPPASPIPLPAPAATPSSILPTPDSSSILPTAQPAK
ncbi:hypothetical protein GCM10007874_48230 [Labrys miyagiensis]|uniref:Invasion associated locus B family protein n=1 Tax=Labrys miyagiensis TaxID=346912 RepID=A0ABQ6CN68_9HYPH|nr:hypothetical protein [Labrys miyagiensis]GLS21806.1 hypothetical protein GCM10007874_48230 [Labrys miyagiensis]